MSIDDGVWEAARAIRPYLADLVGPPAAGGLDRRLADELTTPGERSERTRRLRAILDEHPHTRRFLLDVLADPPHYRPPYEQPRSHRRPAGDAGPLGDLSPVTADRYLCPDTSHDYAWYRPDVGTPVPDCPTHHVPLIRG
jgi:hypothetical protein